MQKSLSPNIWILWLGLALIFVFTTLIVVFAFQPGFAINDDLEEGRKALNDTIKDWEEWEDDPMRPPGLQYLDGA